MTKPLFAPLALSWLLAAAHPAAAAPLSATAEPKAAIEARATEVAEPRTLALVAGALILWFGLRRSESSRLIG